MNALKLIAVAFVLALLAGCAGGSHDPAAVCGPTDLTGECRYGGDGGTDAEGGPGGEGGTE